MAAAGEGRFCRPAAEPEGGGAQICGGRRGRTRSPNRPESGGDSFGTGKPKESEGEGTVREARGAATLDSGSLDSAEERRVARTGFSSLESGRKSGQGRHVWGFQRVLAYGGAWILDTEGGLGK